MAISLGIDAPKLVAAPSAKGWPLVIDKDATVFHLGFSICISTRQYIELVMMGYRRIRHPIPRRHTYLARQLIDTIDGTTLVGTENHQLSLVCENEILLPFALQLFGLLGIFLGDFAFSYCSHHDGSILTARHATQVMAQVSDSHLHSLPVGRTIADGILRARQEKGIIS